MNEFIEKLIGRLEEIPKEYICDWVSEDVCKKYSNCEDCKKNIVREFANQLAEEYKPNTNDAWKIIYDKVCNLEKEYATKGNMASVNDCIRLENLLQYFKEELRSAEDCKHFKAMTNADKIRAMTDEKLAEYIVPKNFDCSDFCKEFGNGCMYNCTHGGGREFILNWLQSEAE